MTVPDIHRNRLRLVAHNAVSVVDSTLSSRDEAKARLKVDMSGTVTIGGLLLLVVRNSIRCDEAPPCPSVTCGRTGRDKIVALTVSPMNR